MVDVIDAIIIAPKRSPHPKSRKKSEFISKQYPSYFCLYSHLINPYDILKVQTQGVVTENTEYKATDSTGLLTAGFRFSCMHK
jgi:hypothetical protein